MQSHWRLNRHRYMDFGGTQLSPSHIDIKILPDHCVCVCAPVHIPPVHQISSVRSFLFHFWPHTGSPQNCKCLCSLMVAWFGLPNQAMTVWSHPPGHCFCPGEGSGQTLSQTGSITAPSLPPAAREGKWENEPQQGREATRTEGWHFCCKRKKWSLSFYFSA